MDKVTEQIRTTAAWNVLKSKLDGWDFEKFPRRITIEVDKGDPIQDTFAVFFIWMAQMSKEFSTDKQEYSVQDMHDLMCNTFLGWTDEKKLGKTVIAPRLVTLTYPERKTKERMCALLSQIEEWAIDRGVYLETKRMSEYMHFKEAQA